MKHATDQTLNQLEELLKEVRKLGMLTEKKRGIFYLKSASFLHFHEDPAGLFADLRNGDDFERYPVNSLTEKKTLLSQLRSALDA